MHERRQHVGIGQHRDVVVESDEGMRHNDTRCGEEVVVERHPDREAQRVGEDHRDEDRVGRRPAACRSAACRRSASASRPGGVGVPQRDRSPVSRAVHRGPIAGRRWWSRRLRQPVDRGGGRAHGRRHIGLTEDHRRGVGVAEGLPDLDRVRDVRHLDGAGGLVGEQRVRRVRGEVVGVRGRQVGDAAASGRSGSAAGRPAPCWC